MLGELTDRGLDVVSGLGERMSAPLLAAVLRCQRRDGRVRGRRRDLIVTDDVHGGAAPHHGADRAALPGTAAAA